ncbi:BQ5605_C013g07215 [Microbotryum silenes-dioicae]|uniref:BQ5605_C013g07215 protein n=1 Tax=Microbotryum silenes-dioicae TaxID=796604 RepID=A0A2X0LRF6_9BASI|nr:BQ5605_C013g07215 [Microbotryum silenes-dioicae]
MIYTPTTRQLSKFRTEALRSRPRPGAELVAIAGRPDRGSGNSSRMSESQITLDVQPGSCEANVRQQSKQVTGRNITTATGELYARTSA